MDDILAGMDSWVIGAAGSLIGGTLVSVAGSVRRLVAGAGEYFESNRAELEAASKHRAREAEHWATEEAIFRRVLGARSGPHGVVSEPVADASTPIEVVPLAQDE